MSTSSTHSQRVEVGKAYAVLAAGAERTVVVDSMPVRDGNIANDYFRVIDLSSNEYLTCYNMIVYADVPYHDPKPANGTPVYVLQPLPLTKRAIWRSAVVTGASSVTYTDDMCVDPFKRQQTTGVPAHRIRTKDPYGAFVRDPVGELAHAYADEMRVAAEYLPVERGGCDQWARFAEPLLRTTSLPTSLIIDLMLERNAWQQTYRQAFATVYARNVLDAATGRDMALVLAKPPHVLHDFDEWAARHTHCVMGPVFAQPLVHPEYLVNPEQELMQCFGVAINRPTIIVDTFTQKELVAGTELHEAVTHAEANERALLATVDEIRTKEAMADELEHYMGQVRETRALMQQREMERAQAIEAAEVDVARASAKLQAAAAAEEDDRLFLEQAQREIDEAERARQDEATADIMSQMMAKAEAASRARSRHQADAKAKDEAELYSATAAAATAVGTRGGHLPAVPAYYVYFEGCPLPIRYAHRGQFMADSAKGYPAARGQLIAAAVKVPAVMKVVNVHPRS
jgi:hypothetical protein